MKKLLFQINSKKGISEIVSYTLLILIAIGLAAGVYSFLKVYVPKYQTPECPPNVHVSVQRVSCDIDSIEFEILNKGFFSIDALYIRLNPPGREIQSIIPNNGFYSFNNSLSPGNITTISKLHNRLSPSEEEAEYTLEIQPAIYKEDGNLAVCQDSVIRQPVNCQ